VLVLTRKIDQQIIIHNPYGEDIIVRVVKMDCNQVKLGIKAPDQFKILRKEIIEQNYNK
jgi:carbon storage regulator